MPGETFYPLSSRGRKPSCAAGWAFNGGINANKTALPSSDHPSDTQPSSAPPTFHGVFLPRPSSPLSVRNQFILDPAPLPFLPPIPLLYRRGDGDRRTGGRVDGRTDDDELRPLLPFPLFSCPHHHHPPLLAFFAMRGGEGPRRMDRPRLVVGRSRMRARSWRRRKRRPQCDGLAKGGRALGTSL